ncbi:MAG: hypothetical protein KIS96_11525 [Bauldia sp.]|nr:hypothetical protein [Bauldia sp.]
MKSKARTDFFLWREAMGFHQKEMARVADAVGMTVVSAGARNRGEVELSVTERLAMSAARVGLPPWSPEVEPDLIALRGIRDVVEAAKHQGARPKRKGGQK